MEATQSTTHACSAEMHVDGNNHGPSYITALGGGEGSVHTRGDTYTCIYQEACTLAALQLSHRLGLDDCRVFLHTSAASCNWFSPKMQG